MYNKIYSFIILVCIGALLVSGCKKLVPSDRDAITDDTQFTIKTYEPILGRTTLYNQNFYSGNSTIPFTFKIINPRLFADGSPANELLDTFPVQIWKQNYTGLETSLEEIENKRAIEYRPLFEIGQHSGNFTMWAAAKTPFVRSLPDSGYIFDVEATNSGGRVYYRNFRLMPLKEIPYEPSNIDPYTGQSTSPYVYPTMTYNIYGKASKVPLSSGGIRVFFNRLGDGNSLSFKFMDTLFHPINPIKFKDTDWKNLVHGFNMQMTDDSVRYDVAYPIPLITLSTRYTTVDGKSANVAFKYHRMGFGSIRQDAVLALHFNIYQPGNWQIVFWFASDNPDFDDE